MHITLSAPSALTSWGVSRWCEVRKKKDVSFGGKGGEGTFSNRRGQETGGNQLIARFAFLAVRFSSFGLSLSDQPAVVSTNGDD